MNYGAVEKPGFTPGLDLGVPVAAEPKLHLAATLDGWCRKPSGLLKKAGGVIAAQSRMGWLIEKRSGRTVASANHALLPKSERYPTPSHFDGDDLMKMLAVLLLSLVPVGALAQTSEDAHVQHMGGLADTALNAQYQRTMAAMALADKTRDADLKDGSSKPDGHPTYQAALIAAERAWLAYRDAHCETVGLIYRGGAYEDEADGKCVNEMDRMRTVELKALLDSMNR